MLAFLGVVILFTAYSFAGWVWELVFIYLTERRWHWRGFLTLPLLPIYGTSALGIIYLVEPYVHNPFLVFMSAVVVITVVELVVSLVLEKLFQIRLWDYTIWPFNFQGRISLFSSLGFGVLGLFLLYVLHPLLKNFVAEMPPFVVFWLGWALLLVIIADFTNSLSSLVRVRLENARLQGTFDDIQHYIDQKVASLRANNRRFRTAIERWHGFNVKQIRKAFPNARTTRKKHR